MKDKMSAEEAAAFICENSYRYLLDPKWILSVIQNQRRQAAAGYFWHSGFANKFRCTRGKRRMKDCMSADEAVETFLKKYFTPRITAEGAVFKPKMGWIQIDWILNLLKSQRQQAAEQERERIRAIIKSRYCENTQDTLHLLINGTLAWALDVLDGHYDHEENANE